MTRRCSHCSNNGHNSRTCPTRSGGGAAASATGSGGGVRLFGVRLTDGSFMKKSKSMGNLSHYHSSLSSTSPAGNASSPSSDHIRNDLNGGYLSDDPNHASCSSNLRSERKKGKPWSEEEHRLFLIGLQKLGKGDWRGISRNYVPSRTPTQVASHAQKYFIRQSNANRRKRRSSLFDMVPDIMVTEEPQTLAEEQLSLNKLTETELSLSRETEEESMVGTPLPASIEPFPYPQFWHPNAFIQHHQVLKPTPVVRKEPVNVDELVGMSRLNLSEKLSLGLLGTPSRQSAFHVSAPVVVSNGAKINNEGKNSAIQAL